MNTESPYVIHDDAFIYENVVSAALAFDRIKQRIIIKESQPPTLRKDGNGHHANGIVYDFYFGVDTDGLLEHHGEVINDLRAVAAVFAWLASRFEHVTATERKEMCERLKKGIVEHYQSDMIRHLEEVARNSKDAYNGPIAECHLENPDAEGMT